MRELEDQIATDPYGFENDGFSITKNRTKDVLLGFVGIAAFVCFATIGVYGYIYYSETAGEDDNRLIPFGKQLWYARHHFRMFFPPLAISSNMFVAQLNDGNLLIYNPIPIPPEMKQQIDKLGTVKYLIVPTTNHYCFVDDFVKEYPQVEIYGARGLQEIIQKKHPELTIKELSEEHPPDPNAWKESEVELYHFQGLRNINEIFLLHKPSRCALIGDLGCNWQQGDIRLKKEKRQPMTIKYLKKDDLFENLAIPTSYRSKIIEKQHILDNAERLSKWKFLGLGMCHGTPILPAPENEACEEFCERVRNLAGVYAEDSEQME